MKRRAWFRFVDRRVPVEELPPRPAPEPDGTAELLMLLPERDRLCLTLYYEQGMTQAEMALTLGVSVPTANRLLRRAQETLRKTLTERTEGGTGLEARQ